MKYYNDLSAKGKYLAIRILYPFRMLIGFLDKTINFFGTKKRQFMAIVLSFVMVLTMLPIGGKNALAAGTNLIVNPGGETINLNALLSSNGWTEETGTNRGYSYEPFNNGPYDGGITLSPKSGNYFMGFYATGSTTYPDGVSCYQDIVITGQSSFDFSGYASLKKDTSGSAIIKIDALNSSGGIINTWSNTATSADGNWKQMTISSDIPTGTANLRVTIKGILNGTGLAAFDDLSLTLGEIPPPVYVAENNNTGVKYINLQEAFDAANANQTIKLLSNITIPSETSITISGNRSFLLDLNGKTLDGGSGYYPLIIHNGSGTFTITDSSTGGKITSSRFDDEYSGTVVLYTPTGSLVIEDGTIENKNSSLCIAINCMTNGTVILKGGEIISDHVGIAGYYTGQILIPTGSSVIKGGTQAMNIAPNYNSYPDVLIHGSTNAADGTDLSLISSLDNSNINTYKYLTFSQRAINAVTLVENGGTYTNGYSEATSYYEDMGLTLPTGSQITKTGYSFLGWTSTNNTNDTNYITAISTNSTGDKTFYAKWADTTTPTGDIKIKTNSVKKILNALTFGWFFKNMTEVTITAQDTSGEAVTVEYYLSDTELTEVGSVTGWTVYQNNLVLAPNHKYFVYAKLTDPSGNVTIINSDDIVVFTDSTQATDTVVFTKATKNDVSATVNLNGNTIKEISNGANKLITGTDYTVSGDTIRFKASYLNTLAAGDYSLTLSYYPMGETGTPNPGSDEPASTSIPLTIVKAVPTVFVTTSPTGSQTRPNSVILSANLPEGATGNLQFKANGTNIGSPVAVGQTVSFTATGLVNDYTFTVSYNGDSNYTTANSNGLTYVFTKGEQAALNFAPDTPAVKTYGDAAFSVTATGGNGIGDVTYTILSGPATISGNTLTLTGVGTVIIRATKAADDDYNAKSVECAITVSPKPVTITGVTVQNKIYDGTKSAMISGVATVSGKIGSDDVSVVNGSASFGDKTIGDDKTVSFTDFALTGDDAGKYTLTAQPANVTATITAKTINMNVIISDKAYDGLNTATITSATLNDIESGDLVSLASPYPATTFVSVGAASDIAVTFAGNFTLTGADAGNYLLMQPSSVKGNITNNYQAKEGTDYTVSTSNWSKTDFIITAKSGFELSITNTPSSTWSDALTKSEETTNGSILFYVRNKSTGAISVAQTESYKIDKTAPTGDIKIGTSSIKEVLNTISFGLFFKDAQTITIMSEDEGSGVDKVYYKLSSVVLEESEVIGITDWSEYSSPIQVNPDSHTIVYLKIMDKVGFTTYLGSDGLVLDKTAPVIDGIENKKVYCKAVNVTVSDSNLDIITVNGTTIKNVDGKFTLEPTDSAQTVVATDQSGNSTTVTVTVYKGHAWNEGVITVAPTASKKGVKTFTCTHCGESKTEEIDKLPPSITEGQNSEWKQGKNSTLTFKSNATLSDFFSVSIDGKIIDPVNYDVKEGSIIITLKPEYIATLPPGKHTFSILSTGGTASTEFLIDTKQTATTKPDNTGTPNTDEKSTPSTGDKSTPKTGENNNLLIWFSLLNIFGGLVVVLGAKRKEK